HPLFVTFRLHGSLPANRVFPSKQMSSGKAFVAVDRLLDQALSGPLLLKQPQIAAFAVDALRAAIPNSNGTIYMHSW
ncbi:MAG TPA: hypothetical protein VH351_23865, partial [Bryobacteraceae bacterium]|nr:hypothetical protein [Bryobacteraceae bacterium]